MSEHAMPERYDVIIIGTGPAGIFSALELVKQQGLKVLMLEKGGDIRSRACPMKDADVPCVQCDLCGILCGWGGAGAYSDGKLTLTSEVGGWLNEYLPKDALDQLIAHVDSLYRKFGAVQEVHGEDLEAVKRLQKKAAGYDLALIPARIRHIGTDLCREVLKNIHDHLRGSVTIRFNTTVSQVIVQQGVATGVRTKDGKEYEASRCDRRGRTGKVPPGCRRRRNGWDCHLQNNPVDIGVRVELPASIMKDITDVTYEAKFVYRTKRFRDRIRTFCMNPYGEVVQERSDRIFSVNGHSYQDKRTANTNFALLVSTDFTQPFHEPITYGKYIAGLANLLGSGVIVQRLGDLKMGRRSTPERIAEGSVRPTLGEATPGDLSFALPYRHLTAIMEMLEVLDNVAPGVNSGDTLLYGVEVKYYSMRLKLTQHLETEIKNLYAVGDGAGVTRGLIQASISGVVAAREILRRQESGDSTQ